MVLTMGRLVRCVAVLSAVLVLFSSGLRAQERGQYVPGFSGLNSDVQAPPDVQQFSGPEQGDDRTLVVARAR